MINPLLTVYLERISTENKKYNNKLAKTTNSLDTGELQIPNKASNSPL